MSSGYTRQVRWEFEAGGHCWILTSVDCHALYVRDEEDAERVGALQKHNEQWRFGDRTKGGFSADECKAIEGHLNAHPVPLEGRTIEHLTIALDAQTYECDKLREANRRLEREVDGSAWGWMLLREIEDVAELPLPRLEIVPEQISDYEMRWRYRIVYKHLCDHVQVVPIGETSSRGSHLEWPPIDHRGRLSLPRRDGAHIYHDAAHFGLPAFIRCGDRVEQLKGLADGYDHQHNMGVKHRREAEAGR